MTEAEKAAREFWRLMATNDFGSVAAVLAPEFVLDWPQSGERVRGAKNFAAVNSEYPANGPWKFEILRLFGGGTEAVSEVAVTDGAAKGRAISFFTVKDGRITKITEFWPEPYPAAANRAHLVERMQAGL